MRAGRLLGLALGLAACSRLAACDKPKKKKEVSLSDERGFLARPEKDEPPFMAQRKANPLLFLWADSMEESGSAERSFKKTGSRLPRPVAETASRPRLEPSLESPASGSRPDPAPPRAEPSAAARDDSRPLSRPEPPPRYRSPAGLKDQPLPARPASFIEPGTAEAQDPAAPRRSVQAVLPAFRGGVESIDAPDVMIADLAAGSFRVQAAPTKRYDSLLLDKVYEFADQGGVYDDLHAAEIPSGFVWVRVAFIDLLGFQHPFTKPRRYRFRRQE